MSNVSCIPEEETGASPGLPKLRKGYVWPLSLYAAAPLLGGVSVSHLRKVLNKQRPSHGLKERYDALVEKMKKEGGKS